MKQTRPVRFRIGVRFLLGVGLLLILWSQLLQAFDPLAYLKTGWYRASSQASAPFSIVRDLHQRALRS